MCYFVALVFSFFAFANDPNYPPAYPESAQPIGSDKTEVSDAIITGAAANKKSSSKAAKGKVSKKKAKKKPDQSSSEKKAAPSL